MSAVTADMLPEDILLAIFSYCPHECLVMSVQSVCRRWRQTCNSRSLWSRVVYKPDMNINKASITEMLKRSPRLQAIDLSYHTFVSDEVFRVLGDHCPELRILRLCERTDVELAVLKNLVSKCPGIEELTMPLRCTDFRMLNIFTELCNLKVLIVKTTLACVGGLNIIACNFPQLEHLELHGVEITQVDLECLIKNKKDKLHTLRLPCIMRDGYCVLPIISQCTKLRTLSLDSLCRTFDMQPEAAPSFLNITSLAIHGGNFSSNAYCSVFFKMFSNVENLQISFCGAYDDSIMDTIARNCPSILRLTFDGGFVGDETLKRLHLVKRLRCLTVRWYSDISSEGLKHLHAVTELSCLRFFQCGYLTADSLEVLSHFRKLQVLEFYQCRRMAGITAEHMRQKLPHVRVTLVN